MFLKVAIISSLIATGAAAQERCGAESVINDMLRSTYGEQPAASGVAANGVLVVQWASPETGTWTIVAYNGNGGACLVASGDGFNAIAAEPNL